MKNRKSKLLLVPLILSCFTLTACSEFISNLLSYATEKIEPKVFAEKIEFREHDISVSKNNQKMLECVFTPANTTNKKLTWSSSNPLVATVENGLFSALNEGETTIKAVSEDGNFEANCKVTVVIKNLEDVSVGRSSLKLMPGNSITLPVVYTPTDASDKEVIWSSSNESIVTVNEKGVVTAKAEAKEGDFATITVKAKNYTYTDYCNVSIIEKSENIAPTELTWTTKDLAKADAHNYSYCPNKGNPKLLVIPVWFTDTESATGLTISNRETVREDIKKVYFGTQKEVGWESVKSFYETESSINGVSKLNLEGTVTDWFECGDSSTKYAEDLPSTSNNTCSLVKKATKWYFDNHPGDSRTNYDSDGDGILDGVMLIYGYPDYRTQNKYSNSNFWAYCYWTGGTASSSNPNVNVFFWASYDFMYGAGKKVGKYGGGDTSHCLLDTHTYIHEMGHVFGLEDYYDYSGTYNPAGCFSMQDMNVGGHDPYSLLSLGWVNPYVPETSCDITLKPFTDTHDLVLLTPELNSYKSPFDEYILLEYYTPDGLNKLDTNYRYQNGCQGTSSSGIRVWHVDSRVVPTDISSLLGGKPDASKLTSNLFPGSKVLKAFSNTYYKEDVHQGYLSPLGENYYSYNLLQLIRRDANKTVFKNGSTVTTNEMLSSSELFKTGDTFSIKKYEKQFPLGYANQMNNMRSLGYTFEVTSITSKEAKIKIIAE